MDTVIARASFRSARPAGGRSVSQPNRTTASWRGGRCHPRVLASGPVTYTAEQPSSPCSLSSEGAVQSRGGEGLRGYEIMLILPADADESIVGTAVDRITKVVGAAGGEVGGIDRWGRRRFAYEIDDQPEG